MSEDALNQAIAAKWESAGLDASHEGLEAIGDGADAEAVVEDGADDASAAEDSGAEDVVADDATVESADADVAEADADPAAEADPETPSAEETPAAAEKTEQEQVQHVAEDELAAALGLGKPPDDPKKRAQWWKTRVPYSQVHKLVAEREKKLTDAHTSRMGEYDTRFADVAKVEGIIKEKPEQYVKTLAAIFPDTYGKMFAPILGGAGSKADTETLETSDVPAEMPPPNLKLSDGTETYDLKGIKDLTEWIVASTEQRMLKKFKPQMDFLNTEKTRQEEAALAEQRATLGQQTAAEAIADVKTWDLGEAHLQEILDEAAKLDPSYDAHKALSIAYRKIVVPKLKADRETMRKEILAEGKKASAKATSLAVSQTGRTQEKPAASAVDLDTRIKAVWKKKGLI